MKYLKEYIVPEIICLLIVLVCGYALTLKLDCGKKIDVQSRLNREIQRNDSLIAVIQTLKAARKDSLPPIIKYIQVEKERTDQAIAGIQNVQDIDSLVNIYKSAKVNYNNESADVLALDSTGARFGKDEVRFVSGAIMELNFLKNTEVRGLEQQIGILTRIAEDSDSIIGLKDADIALLNKKVNDLLPDWWDRYKFYAGVIGGVVVAILIKGL